jgi:hypothetical protein
MYNDFTWGGYLLYAWPEQKVFIDGQTDFYGEPLSKLYMSIRQAQPGWDRRLDSLGVQLVLIPEDAPLSQWLMVSNAWILADSVDGAMRFDRMTTGRSGGKALSPTLPTSATGRATPAPGPHPPS